MTDPVTTDANGASSSQTESQDRTEGPHEEMATSVHPLLPTPPPPSSSTSYQAATLPLPHTPTLLDPRASNTIPAPRSALNSEDEVRVPIFQAYHHPCTHYGSHADWRPDYMDLNGRWRDEEAEEEAKDWSDYSFLQWLRVAWPKVVCFTLVLIAILVGVVVAIVYYLQA